MMIKKTQDIGIEITDDELVIYVDGQQRARIDYNLSSLGVIHDFLILFGFSTDDYNEVIQTITTGG